MLYCFDAPLFLQIGLVRAPRAPAVAWKSRMYFPEAPNDSVVEEEVVEKPAELHEIDWENEEVIDLNMQDDQLNEESYLNFEDDMAFVEEPMLGLAAVESEVGVADVAVTYLDSTEVRGARELGGYLDVHPDKQLLPPVLVSVIELPDYMGAPEYEESPPSSPVAERKLLPDDAYHGPPSFADSPPSSPDAMHRAMPKSIEPLMVAYDAPPRYEAGDTPPPSPVLVRAKVVEHVEEADPDDGFLPVAIAEGLYDNSQYSGAVVQDAHDMDAVQREAEVAVTLLSRLADEMDPARRPQVQPQHQPVVHVEPPVEVIQEEPVRAAEPKPEPAVRPVPKPRWMPAPPPKNPDGFITSPLVRLPGTFELSKPLRSAKSAPGPGNPPPSS
jgi:hypothetical protein